VVINKTNPLGFSYSELPKSFANRSKSFIATAANTTTDLAPPRCRHPSSPRANASEDARDHEDEGVTVEVPDVEEEKPGGEGDAGQSSSCPAPPNPSKAWKKSKLKTEDILALVNNGFLREIAIDGWNAATGDAYPMEKNPEEILMFAHFRGLLEYYGIKHST
jgi:hypothetical protein